MDTPIPYSKYPEVADHGQGCRLQPQNQASFSLLCLFSLLLLAGFTCTQPDLDVCSVPVICSLFLPGTLGWFLKQLGSGNKQRSHQIMKRFAAVPLAQPKPSELVFILF